MMLPRSVNARWSATTTMTTRTAIVLVFLVLCAGSPAQVIKFPDPMHPDDCAPGNQQCVEMKNRREKALNEERYRDLKRDTDRLLALATDLKNAVDKTTSNTLSVEVIKKTEEIERLSRSVRNKMRGY